MPSLSLLASTADPARARSTNREREIGAGVEQKFRLWENSKFVALTQDLKIRSRWLTEGDFYPLLFSHHSYEN